MKIVLVLMLIAVASLSSVKASCHVEVRGQCFTFIDHIEEGGLDKIKAEKECQKINAHLADINTEEEMDSIYFYLKGHRQNNMVLLGMKYVNNKILLKGGVRATYKPRWYEGHPKSDKNYNEMLFLVTSSEKHSGLMNSENGCVYTTVLCRG